MSVARSVTDTVLPVERSKETACRPGAGVGAAGIGDIGQGDAQQVFILPPGDPCLIPIGEVLGFPALSAGDLVLLTGHLLHLVQHIHLLIPPVGEPVVDALHGGLPALGGGVAVVGTAGEGQHGDLISGGEQHCLVLLADGILPLGPLRGDDRDVRGGHGHLRDAVCHHGVGDGDFAAGQQARQDGTQDQQHGQSQ